MYPTITRRNQALGAAVLTGLMLGIGCAGGASDGSPTPGPVASVGDAGPSPSADPSCKPQPAADVPDDDFADTNCDGIDGDKAHAIFVAPTGADSAAGSLEAPVRTLAKALALATGAKKDVYVCNGTYAESVVVANIAVGIYGGYDCANGWARGNDRATIAPATGIPLTIRDLTAMTVDRIALHAPDATDPSASSIGAFMSNAHDVQLAHVSVAAGLGADGATPPAPASLTQLASSGSPGRSLLAATCTRNDPNLPAACNSHGAGGFAIAAPPACEGAGGAGGDGGNVLHGVANTVGFAGAPASAGGMNHGDNGTDGAHGSNGASASVGVGTVTASGYVASNGGTDGADGAPGGGGAGGVGGLSRYVDNLPPYYFNAGGGGGQGGNGGCGGVAGKAGGAGGASIGVLLFSSDARLRSSSIRTSAGGKGGRSVAGARGQFGGVGGGGGLGTRYGAYPGNGEPGGNGGNGGDGGSGGAGGGGPSIGILSNDRQPTTIAVTFNTASGGKGGSGAGRTDGADGVARDILVLNDTDAGASDSGTRD